MTDDSRREDTDGVQSSTEHDLTSAGQAPGKAAPVAVSLDKSVAGGPLPEGRQSQQGGASPWAAVPDALTPDRVPAQSGTVQNGAAQNGMVQSGVNLPAVQGDVAQRKLIAGLLGILLGSLGVHKFYLGLTQPGVIMLVCTLAGYVLFTLLAIILIGFVFLLLPAVVGVVGLVEGVLYLTKSDADFEREYLIGKKPWF